MARRRPGSGKGGGQTAGLRRHWSICASSIKDMGQYKVHPSPEFEQKPAHTCLTGRVVGHRPQAFAPVLLAFVHLQGSNWRRTMPRITMKVSNLAQLSGKAQDQPRFRHARDWSGLRGAHRSCDFICTNWVLNCRRWIPLEGEKEVPLNLSSCQFLSRPTLSLRHRSVHFQIAIRQHWSQGYAHVLHSACRNPQIRQHLCSPGNFSGRPFRFPEGRFLSSKWQSRRVWAPPGLERALRSASAPEFF